MPDVNIIDGRGIAAQIRADIADKTSDLLMQKGKTPGLAVILVGEDPASQVYVRAKRKAAIAAGMNSFLHILSSAAEEEDVIAVINDLNGDDHIHGILVQMPLPVHINSQRVIEAIDPHKDVDGLHPLNIGKLALGRPGFVPCTPLGCLHLIKSLRSDLTGLNATIVGASNLVGKPMAQLLLREKCTVTQAHSQTRDLVSACNTADILVIATGAAGLITAEHVKDGAIIIDVGISRKDDKTLIGDVDFRDVTAKRNCAITPVPGGVGPMTIAMLLSNTFDAAKNGVFHF